MPLSQLALLATATIFAVYGYARASRVVAVPGIILVAIGIGLLLTSPMRTRGLTEYMDDWGLIGALLLILSLAGGAILASLHLLARSSTTKKSTPGHSKD